MESKKIGSGVVWAVTLMLALVGCAPPQGGPTEGAEGTGAAAGARQEEPAKSMVTTYDPVRVDVKVTAGPDGCKIEVSKEDIVLHKDPTLGSNKALWTWSGAQYESVWVSVPENDLRTCLDVDSLKGDSGKKGFQIVMPDGTRKTVDPADTCNTGTYSYEIGARGKEGIPDCGADPTVKIED